VPITDTQPSCQTGRAHFTWIVIGCASAMQQVM
jgi:hypothetical protein